jgi:hypothetical protein
MKKSYNFAKKKGKEMGRKNWSDSRYIGCISKHASNKSDKIKSKRYRRKKKRCVYLVFVRKLTMFKSIAIYTQKKI